ncbi:MAG TPA: condensation domain-containing protein, partial [Thermoanaerobaculia bacterium]
RLEPGSPVYHLPGAIRLAGPLDEIALERALAEIARRHEALRTVLREERGEPVQVVLPPAAGVLPRIDLTGAGQADAEAARLAHEIAMAPFDLARGPLFRALLLRRGPEDHELLLTLHHVVADGWSLGILLAELAALYEAFAAGLPSPLPELPAQYADWAVWQRERAGLAEQVAWWRERLAGMAPLALPVDRPRTAVRSSRGGTRSLTLPAAGVEALARRAGATPFMVLLAAFQAQLARYADAPSVPVGSPVANRGAAEAEGLIGFFVNMLVLRTPVEGDPAFLELLDRVREVCLGAYAHQDVPFERLVEELRPERRRARNPLFQAVFQLEEPLWVERLGAAAVTVERLETGTAKFDLMLSVVRQPEGLAATLEFDAGLFDPSTAERLLEHWRRVVEGIAAGPDRPLSALLPLSEEEIAQLRSRPSEVEDDGWEEPAVGYVAPRTPEEERLAAIWREVLGVERVGVHDDFFELGGHSLLAIRVLARVGEAFGTELPLSDLFEASTVAGLAQRLAAGAALPEASGKVPETEPHVSTAEPVFPGTEVEEWLAGIWREVLGVDHVGLHDDFFELGGHSLLAVRVLTRIRDGLGIDLPLTTMFEAPTVAGLAGRLTGGAVEAAPELTEGVERLPLSLAQQRLWLLDRLEPGTPKYNVPMSVRLEGRLALRPLALALAGIVRRHEPLRTVYVQGELGPAQAVLPAVEIPFARVDLSALPAPARERALSEALRAEAVRPFDLARGPVVRFLLAALGPEESVLLASFHHIATDGWSMSIFFRELAILYGDLLAGRGPSLPEPAVRYADWAVWQRRALEGGALAPQLAWWRRELAGLPVLDLPTDRPRSAGDDRGTMRPVELPGELIQALRGLGRREGATLANVLMAGFAALLATLSGQDDFGVGLPAAGRNRLHAEELIGFFVNTLVARVQAADDPPFAALLGRLRDAALAAQARQDVPFERLVEELQPERATGVTPLFQVAFNALASPLPAVPMTGLELSLLDVGVGVSKFDLTLSIYEEAGRLRAWAEYRTGLLDPATVERWMGHLRFLLAAAAADPALPLSELPLLSPAERWQLAGEQNDTALALPLDRCLHELFEAQAARTPDAPAVIAEDGELTYRQLDAFAGRLARRLRRLGVGPDTAVGVFAERSAAQVAAVLGVLKAGGAYVPLDPAYPAERLAGMLEDAGAPVLLAPEALLDRLPPHRARVLVLDGEESDAEEAAAPRSGPDNLAAVIFTSGSTGRPKGVMLPHRGLANRLLWAQEVYRLSPDDAVLLKAALGFDFSLWEMLAPLIAGARLVVARSGGHLDAGYLARVIAERGVTVVHFVPSMLDVFLGEEGATAEGCPSLRQVFSGGEALTPALRERFLARFPGVPLDNQYGPTEIS